MEKVHPGQPFTANTTPQRKYPEKAIQLCTKLKCPFPILHRHKSSLPLTHPSLTSPALPSPNRSLPMAPKFCFPIPFPTNHKPNTKSKHRFHLHLSDQKSHPQHSHSIQFAISSAKQHTLTLSRRGCPFPLKYFRPGGQSLELYKLLGRFSDEISQGALEISPNLKSISDCKFPALHCSWGKGRWEREVKGRERKRLTGTSHNSRSSPQRSRSRRENVSEESFEGAGTGCGEGGSGGV
jgi:hypothetical protein